MAYKQNQTLYKRQRQARKFRTIVLSFVILVFMSTGAIAVDFFYTNMRNDNTVVTTEQNRSVQSSNISIYRTKYFQFQAVDDWVEVKNDTYPGERYVYVKNKGSLITQRLTVYIDRNELEKEQDIKITHVLPVDVGPLGRFINVGKVSEHCDTSWPSTLKRNPSRIVHDNVSFVCAPDSSQYNIVIGEQGDDENITIDLTEGSRAEITIVYSDLTAYPSAGDIYNIIDSFVTL